MPPTVQAYNGPQIEQAAVPNARVDTNVPSAVAFGGGAGALLGDVTEFAQKAKSEADAIAVQNFDNKMTSAAHDDLHNPKTGALNLKGENALFKDGAAFDLSKERGDNLDKTYGELKQNLHGSDQIAGANRAYRDIKLAHSDALEKHISAQAAEFYDNTDKNGIELAKQEAATNWFDSSKVENSIQKKNEIIDRMAARNGLPATEVQVQKLKTTSDAYKDVLNQKIDGLIKGQTKYEDVESYFSNVKDNMTADDKKSINDLLRKTGAKHEGLLISDKLFDQYKDNPTKAYTMLSQDKIPSDAVREAARDGFREAMTSYSKYQEEGQKNLYQSLYNIKDSGGTPTPSQLHQLTPTQQEALKNYDKSRVDDVPFVYDLRTMAANPQTRGDFKKMNLVDPKNYTRMSDQTFKELTALQNKHNDDAAFHGVQKIEETIKDNYVAAGLPPPDKKDPASMLQYQQYRDSIDAEIRRTKDDSPDNINKVMKNLLKTTILIKRPWFLPDTATLNMNAGKLDLDHVDLDSIDPAIVNQIKTTLKNSGRNPNDEDNVKRVLLDALKAGRI